MDPKWLNSNIIKFYFFEGKFEFHVDFILYEFAKMWIECFGAQYTKFKYFKLFFFSWRYIEFNVVRWSLKWPNNTS